MRKGFQLIRKLDFKPEGLNELLGLPLTPKFRLFAENFDLEKLFVPQPKLQVNDEIISLTIYKQFEEVEYNGEFYTAIIDRLFTPTELIQEYSKFLKRLDHWHDLGLMKIGLLFHGDVLLLGMQEANQDQIWRYGSGLLNTQANCLDKDIFKFFNRLVEQLNSEDLAGIDIDSIYQSFNSDIWRMKN